MKKLGAFLLLLLLPSLASLASVQPLAADQAFLLSTQLAPNNTIIFNWNIAAKHYLYQQRFSFKILHPQTAKTGSIAFPPAETRQDDILGTYQVYTNTVSIPVPIVNAGNDNVILLVSYQGCSEDGYCYPPVSHEVIANFIKNIATTDVTTAKPALETSKITKLLAEKNLGLIFLAFVGFGILLSFTPCVLPMIPILSGIILGHGHSISTGKAFRLSLTYVLSMSVTYAIAGILVGYIGGSLQTLFQKPWVIILFSVIFVLMALSMFGLYNLEPPKKLEALLAKVSAHQNKGHYIGVAIMGCLGTLIVSPCVTPALIAALSYISQKGDMWLGGVSLFATGLGMGIPLLLIGTSAKLIPKAGHWMVTVKTFLGVILLAMAIFMLSRILPGRMIMLLWALLLIGCAIYLGALSNGSKAGWQKFWRGVGLAMLVYGVVLIIGSAMGNSDPFKPFAKKEISETIFFQRVKTIQDLNEALNRAKLENKPVILDFYADWCVSCKEMDHTTFANNSVKETLKNFIVLRADVTANDDDDKNLMSNYNVIAPPTILFFAKGLEIKNLRIVGALGPNDFMQYLQQAIIAVKQR